MDATLSKNVGYSIDLSQVADVLPAIIGVYDVNSGQYVYVNQAVGNILGYKPEDFLRGGIEFVSQLIHPNDLDKITEQNQKAIREANRPGFLSHDDNIVCFEYRVRHSDGHWIWLHTEGRVYGRGSDGRVETVLNVSIEITERKEAEKKLKAQTLELSDINRSKDEFVAIASHQLRTPATAVRQYLSLLLEGYTDPLTPGQKQFIKEAYENNERQLMIVDDILRVARLDLNKITLNLRCRDIVKKVREVARGFKDKFADREQKVTVHKPANSREILVDPNLMRTVIENILENASKYTPHGQRIDVFFEFSTDAVDVIVKDQGVGIAAEDLPRLFQKFSRIENPLSIEVGGTGLGLYWSEKIVARHGGEIKVESSVGKGSSFIIRLPLNGPGNVTNERQERLNI